jgi:hypothetical protein
MSSLYNAVRERVSDSLLFNIAGVDVQVDAPQTVLAVLHRTLGPVSRGASRPGQPIVIEVTCETEDWYISETESKSRKVLGRDSALPQVAGATISSMVAAVAKRANLTVCRGAVVEKDGKAFAMTGDDWESCVTLAAHLHTRGWRIVGGDYALIDRASVTAVSFRKLLYTTSSSIDSLPLKYRRAIEASPWYSTKHGIAFYAVDPALAGEPEAWSERAALRGLLRLDGHTADFPALETCADFEISDGLRASELEASGVEVAKLTIGSVVETCDLLEHWFKRFA